MMAGYSRVWGRTCHAVHVEGGELVALYAERRRGHVRWTKIPPERIALRREVPVVGALTPRESFTRWVEAPFASRRKALKVVPTLLDVQLPFALDECLYSLLHIERTARGTTRLLVAGARLTDIRARVKCLSDVGADPVILDQEGLALWTQSLREIPPQGDSSATLRLVVFWGRERAVVSVGRGREFANAHLLRPVDATQLRRILLAHCDGEGGTEGMGRSPESVQWFWAGPGAEDGETVRKLVNAVGPEWQGVTRVHDEPALFLARALAVRALTTGTLRCNLRAGSETHPALVRHVARTKRWAALLLLATGLSLSGLAIWFNHTIWQRISTYERTCFEMAERLAGFHVTARGDDAIAVVRRAVEARKKDLSPFRAIFEPSLLDTLIHVSQIGQRNGLRFDTFAIGPHKMTITGVAPAYDSCRDLLGYLNDRGYGANLERKPLTAQGMIPFVISSGGDRE